MNFSAETLDELLRIVLTHFLHRQDLTPINPRKGSAKEEFGVLLELKNPRARLSRTEIKGTPFSCLGELSWYLSGSNSLAHMQYYIDRYDEFSDDGETIHGAYGPRLKNMHGEFNQIENIIQFLRDHSDSRRAVIQIYDASDLVHDGKDVPCTTAIQFIARNGRLSMLTSMRSNDVFLGLPHDIFCFTMIQEIIASQIGLEVGVYKHSVGSLHLYDDDVNKAKSFVNEGYQSTKFMDKMPTDNVSSDIEKFLRLEKLIREKGNAGLDEEKINVYWDDLIILLKAFRSFKERDANDIKKLNGCLTNRLYSAYIKKLELKIIKDAKG